MVKNTQFSQVETAKVKEIHSSLISRTVETSASPTVIPLFVFQQHFPLCSRNQAWMNRFEFGRFLGLLEFKYFRTDSQICLHELICKFLTYMAGYWHNWYLFSLYYNTRIDWKNLALQKFWNHFHTLLILPPASGLRNH